MRGQLLLAPLQMTPEESADHDKQIAVGLGVGLAVGLAVGLGVSVGLGVGLAVGGGGGVGSRVRAGVTSSWIPCLFNVAITGFVASFRRCAVARRFRNIRNVKRIIG